MKKKILLSFLAMAFCFTLTGCGNSDKEEVIDDTSNDIEETIENTNESGVEEELKLYSDDTKYVFQYGNITHVFYYSGDTITAYHSYIDYGDNNTATLTNNLLSVDDLTDIDKHYVKGKYIVFEHNKSQYEDMTVEELKTAYSYMQEVKEQ